jgi:hypothetical protein
MVCILYLLWIKFRLWIVIISVSKTKSAMKPGTFWVPVPWQKPEYWGCYMPTFKISLPMAVLVFIQFSFFGSLSGGMRIRWVLHFIALECLSGEDHVSDICKDAHLPFLCVKMSVKITWKFWQLPEGLSSVIFSHKICHFFNKKKKGGQTFGGTES